MASLFDVATGLRIRNSSHRVAVELAAGEKISNQVATNDLRGMVQAGLVIQRGAKRGSHYVATDQLREIAAKVKVDREPIDASTLFEV
jgi:hypothetical protein